MRIKGVRIQDYKRFSDLCIDGIPSDCRLVVLIGPNGSGKSSLFDAFLLKGQSDPAVRNVAIGNDLREYYFRNPAETQKQSATAALWQQIEIDFHENPPAEGAWAKTFNIRSPYRNEAQFQVTELSAVPPASEQRRFSKIIESDLAVSDNYRRMAWKRLRDLDQDERGSETFRDYRAKSLGPLQEAVNGLFPDLRLQDFGGITGGTGFRFAKGSIADFPYQNLSSGEKAALDLLLDIFVKRHEYQDAVYCIDEPEAHTAVAVQGRLLEALLSMLPVKSQLWIATHSIGFVRAAHKRAEQHRDVVFLDFSEENFDTPVNLSPVSTGRAFWRRTYRIALDDLAELVGPARIVLCEGRKDKPSEGFDAQCYARLFGDTHGDTIFLSRGGANEVEKSENLAGIIEEIVEGIEIVRLIDRDDMTDEARAEKLRDPYLRVLSRREIENYLYDPQVLGTFFATHGVPEVPADLLELLVDHRVADLGQVSRKVLDGAKKELKSVLLGNDRQQFELGHLAPALKDTPAVYGELETDIFG